MNVEGRDQPREDHWNRVYTSRPSGGASWFQATPATSLELLDAAGLAPET
jgi:hypothetical protein